MLPFIKSANNSNSSNPIFRLKAHTKGTGCVNINWLGESLLDEKPSRFILPAQLQIFIIVAVPGHVVDLWIHLHSFSSISISLHFCMAIYEIHRQLVHASCSCPLSMAPRILISFETCVSKRSGPGALAFALEFPRGRLKQE